MRRSKFSESQIVAILNEVEAGVAIADVVRKAGISKATFFALTLIGIRSLFICN